MLICRTRLTVAVAVAAGLVVLGGGRAAAQRRAAPAEPVVPALLEAFTPVTDEMLHEPAEENWITYRNGYNLWGFSPLDQIDSENAGELRLGG